MALGNRLSGAWGLCSVKERGSGVLGEPWCRLIFKALKHPSSSLAGAGTLCKISGWVSWHRAQGTARHGGIWQGFGESTRATHGVLTCASRGDGEGVPYHDTN